MDGFRTRAIRAASRTRRADQRPTSVPIYRAATLSAVEAASGIAPGMLRVAVGPEDPRDLLADVAQALEAARGIE